MAAAISASFETFPAAGLAVLAALGATAFALGWGAGAILEQTLLISLVTRTSMARKMKTKPEDEDKAHAKNEKDESILQLPDEHIPRQVRQ